MALFKSSTQQVLDVNRIPQHIAIIMDGNGRWAKKRFMPRVMGHQRGVESVRAVIEACDGLGVQYLTLFAFSSENWRRPADEVSFLMQLFMKVLQQEVDRMHERNIRLRVIGDRSRFDKPLIALLEASEAKTAHNTGLTLTVAANYGGRWDITQAFTRYFADHPQTIGTPPSEEQLAPYLSMQDAPEPDLFIRTGGEERISNFLLWQLAYSELYFTDILWPDFRKDALLDAIKSYQQRERRFGRISEQLPHA